jgi:hypothetical protein
MESSCIAKSFYCWTCVEKGNNKTSDTVILGGRRNSAVAIDRNPNPEVKENSNQLIIYQKRDIELILEDYSYFETFTGIDPSCRDSMPSNYINKHAKCYKNLRQTDSYVLVWQINVNEAYIEHVTEHSLENFQVSNGSFQDLECVVPKEQLKFEIVKNNDECGNSLLSAAMEYVSSLDIGLLSGCDKNESSIKDMDIVECDDNIGKV